ncbi:2-hydroxyacid dehydrogenase [Aminobacter sp. AP02]|uniref:2-hydroxyacid dehydrogenase n=1 Tax=Aminobacter sp. AP02 TaxID=2135737 RepID=UPI000D6D3F7A|nr:2-hydroxyacid dehydrogenase [Aminobacter sp. AP02]PWK65752.1 lactate dehydrogenase-like 2-hydroxyacid dehydrogenase [Aminobacter sp. AP02]
MSASNIEAPAILIPGRMHPHVTERLKSAFPLIHIADGDPALLSAEMKASVRGIASMGTVNAAFIDALPNLEIIANFGVGYDAVDAAHAASRGIMVTNTPDVLTEEVADTAIGLLINTVRELPRAEDWLRQGRWVREGGYRLTATLRGRRIGIFGMGRIGLAVARRLEAFGLPIAYHNRRRIDGIAYAYFPTLKELAAAVDTLISVAPATPQTEKIVNAEIFEALGADGIFVNVGRGATVDEAALVEALSKGTILAAGLDVFADEPNVPQALIDLPNASLLPHVASATVHTRQAMADLAADNIFSWFSSERRALTPVPETAHVTATG